MSKVYLLFGLLGLRNFIKICRRMLFRSCSSMGMVNLGYCSRVGIIL